MKLHDIERVHSGRINSVLVSKNASETAGSSKLTPRTRGSMTEEFYYLSVYPKDPKHEISWDANPKIFNCQSRHREQHDIVLDLECLSNLSLTEILSEPPQIIGLETAFLESNYQSDYLVKIQEEIKPKILVVENRDESRSLICSSLQTENFQVIEAKDSNTAIEKAKKEVPDLIVCELMMPIIDGYGIAYLLRQSKITARIPLLFITAQFEETDIVSRIILITDRTTI